VAPERAAAVFAEAHARDGRRLPGDSQPTVDMLRPDGGELLTFALVSARTRDGKADYTR
jgi:hypothetical protein